MRMANLAYPGEIIAETLKDMHVSLRQFAKAMNIAPSTASRLLSGQTTVTPEMALRLSAVVGSTPGRDSTLYFLSSIRLIFKHFADEIFLFV